MEPTESAPATELRLASALRRYERVKLALMIAVLIIVSTSTSYLIGIANATKQIGQDNKTSLSILSCAVSREVQEAGQPNSQEQRTAFDACLKRGHPKVTPATRR